MLSSLGSFISMENLSSLFKLQPRGPRREEAILGEGLTQGGSRFEETKVDRTANQLPDQTSGGRHLIRESCKGEDLD